ncbi:MAG: cyclic nucleotide-binding domain-containing protein [Myxococcota bacterium]
MAIETRDLRRVELFESLVPEHLKLILGITREEQHPPSAVLFRDGDVADRLYFVVKGKVRVSKEIPGVGEEALAVLEEGHYFGEMALIDHAPRSASAICNTSVVVGAIDRNAFEDLLFIHKDLAYDLLWTLLRTLSVRLRETNEKMGAFLAMAGRF